LGSAPAKDIAKLFKLLHFIDFSGVRKMLPELFVASAVINLLSMALPVLMLQIYDRIIPHQALSTLTLLLGGVITALLLECAIRCGRSYITGWLGASFEHKLSCACFRRLLDCSVADYEREGATVHMERIRATGAVRDFYSGQALLAVFDMPFALLYLTLIYILGGWIVLIPLTLMTLFAVAALFNSRNLTAFIEKRTIAEERRFSFIGQALSGIHTVKTMAMELLMQRRYEMLQDSNVHMNFDGSRFSINVLNLSSLFSQVSTILISAVGAVFVVHNTMTPGVLSACVILTGRSLQPIQNLLGTWSRIQQLMVAQDQITKLFAIPPAPSRGRPPLPDGAGGLRLDAVTLTYPGASKPLFEALDLTIIPGECIGIVGDSGSGKTALLSMMAGMISPSDGRVLADDHDLSLYDPSSLAGHIGCLPQQGVLVDGTILENITMYDASLENKALAIAHEIGLDRAVATMRNGYSTSIANSSSEAMPGGIKQRIAIARALVRDPEIILFDEANVALDAAGDDALRAYLARLKGQRTIVMVTYRPSHLKLADRLFRLKDGGIVPTTMEEVMADMGQGPQAPAPTSAPTPDQALSTESFVKFERPPNNADYQSVMSSRIRERSDFSNCLPQLLQALEWRGTMRNFAEALPHFDNRLSLEGFRRVMANLFFTCKVVAAKLSDVDESVLPCLFVAEDGHAMVVLEYEPGQGFKIFDGATNGYLMVEGDQIRGQAQIFRSGEASGRIPGASWMATVANRFRPLIVLCLVLTMGINVLALGSPIFVLLIYDRLIPSGNVSLIPWMLVGLAISLAVDGILRRLRARILSYMGARGEYIIGSTIFQRILSLPATSIEQVPVGSQVARIKDFESLRDLFVGPLALIAYELPGTVVYVVVLTLVDNWLLVIMVLSASLFALYGFLLKPALLARTVAVGAAGSKRQELLTDALAKMSVIKYSGAEERWYQRFRLLSAKSVAAELANSQLQALLGNGSQTIGMFTGLAVIVTCVIGAISGSISVGSVVMALLVTWRLVTPLQNSFLSFGTLARTLRSVKQIDNLMRMHSEARDPTAIRQVANTFRGALNFARVSFRYSNESDPVLLGVNVQIEPHQVVAIAGPNGAGKSSLLKLITGIYQPQAGSVRLDDIDIRQLPQSELRTVISYAPQRCDVFFGTIAQNLRLNHPTATDDELKWACRMAGLLDDIQNLPDGFNTRIFDGQSEQMAHGFRQRLLLARTYLKPASVMLFDEPGNGLDTEGDNAFHEAVMQLKKNTTIVFVSHRPSHLRLADQVIYLDSGYVKQVGKFDQVKELVFGGGR
jgi:ATP-binding cassette subfamily C protein LapB